MKYKEVIQGGKDLIDKGLTFGTGGNISARVEGGFLITPSGMDYKILTESDLVNLSLTGEVIKGKQKPSSEWAMHALVYEKLKEAKAIVHSHSKYINILSCTGKCLPAIHYLLACTGGSCVNIAPYRSYGTRELAEVAVEAMGNTKAVILSNHGLLAWGESVEEAINITETVEFCAFLYIEALKIGTPSILSDKEMNHMVRRFSNYGNKKETL